MCDAGPRVSGKQEIARVNIMEEMTTRLQLKTETFMGTLASVVKKVNPE